MNHISKTQFERIVRKLKQLPNHNLVDLILLTGQEIKRPPKTDEIESLMLYLNKDKVPQA
jgi:hypothetical protein